MLRDDDTTPTGGNDTRSRNIRTLLSVLMERYSNYEVDLDAGHGDTTRFYVQQDGARLYCDVSNEALASKDLTREQTEVLIHNSWMAPRG